IGNYVGEFAGLAGVRQSQDHIVRPDHPEIAVAGFDRVNELRRGACRSQRSSDLTADMTAFPHPGNDYPSLHRDAGVYGVCKSVVERLRQTFETADFGAYHSAGDVEIGIAKRPTAECRWLPRFGSRAGIDRHRKDPLLRWRG